MSDSIENKQHQGPLFGSNAPIVEALYEAYLEDPNSIDANWRSYFEETLGAKTNGEIPHGPIVEEFAQRLQYSKPVAAGSGSSDDLAIHQLIEAYRLHGHRAAQLDPLGLKKAENLSQLNKSHYGLSNGDSKFSGTYAGKTGLSLKEIENSLKDNYANTIGAEFAHIADDEERNWLYERLESVTTTLSKEEKIYLLEQVTAAEGIESYLHTR